MWMPFVVHLLAVLAGLFATATGSAAPETTGLALPATFRGDLPCADCVAIRHHLDLWPDGVFHLRRTWLGRPAPAGAAGDFFVDDSGRWQRDDVRRVLVLHGGAAMPLQFSITGPRRLRALDRV